MTILKAIDELIAREGGYVDHPDDKGGPTRYGITEKRARANNYHGPMQDLPRSVAESIYINEFYLDTNICSIKHAGIMEEVLDSAVLHGPGTAVKWLQHCLSRMNKGGTLYPDLKPDGVLGSVTIKALNTYLEGRARQDGAEVLLKALNCLQGHAMLYMGEFSESFIFGWLRERIKI